MAVDGGYAYVGFGPGLVVVGATQPRSPHVVGSIPGYYVSALAADGPTAYVAGIDELLIVEVTTTSTPAR